MCTKTRLLTDAAAQTEPVKRVYIRRSTPEPHQSVKSTLVLGLFDYVPTQHGVERNVGQQLGQLIETMWRVGLSYYDVSC